MLRTKYILIGLSKGEVHDLCPLSNSFYPEMLVYKECWIVISGDSVLRFKQSGQPESASPIQLPPTVKTNPILGMTVQKDYLLVFRQAGASVYNLLDSARVQEIEFERDFGFRDFACDGGFVHLALERIGGGKVEPSSVMFLQEVPTDEIIKRLLLDSKVPEAQHVFSLNNPPADEAFAAKKEQFNIEVAWALFKRFQFSQSLEFFQQVNYDPRHLLSLVPDMFGPRYKDFKTLKHLVENAAGTLSNPDAVIQEGTRTIINLVEERRRYFAERFDLSKDGKKLIAFVSPAYPINEIPKPKGCTLDDLLEIVDTSLLKMYVEQKQVKPLQTFLESLKVLKCNEKEMEAYLKEREKDRTFTVNVCQGLLAERFDNVKGALTIWKSLGVQAAKDVRDIACKETVKLLINKVQEKKIFFEYAKMILIANPEEGIKIFTENASLPQFLNEDDIVTYLDSLEGFQTTLKERYLEYLVSKPESQERFHTLLALHYVNKIKENVKKQKTQLPESLNDPMVAQYRTSLFRHLQTSKSVSADAVLDSINGLNLLKEEIYLFSVQGKHDEALVRLVETGKNTANFKEAEQYCVDQPVPLFATLFEKMLKLFKVAQDNYVVMNNVLANNTSTNPDKEKARREIESQKTFMDDYENACKSFLKRHATNEKMDAEAVLKMIPDDWSLKDAKDDDILQQYIALTLNDRLGKEINYKIAKHVGDMLKLHVDAQQVQLQKAYVLLNEGNMCKVCKKTFNGAKSFNVFPNGIVVHTQCVKDSKVCPVKGINFSKKVYE